MQRREWCAAMAGALLVSDLAGPLRARRPGGPLFFLASRAQTRVYLLGFGEAKDRSWLTAPIERAFNESTDLWLEGPGPAPKDEDPAAKQAAADRMDKLGRETGRTLFDALEPPSASGPSRISPSSASRATRSLRSAPGRPTTRLSAPSCPSGPSPPNPSFPTSS